jgi:Tfp pilus assembly protein PilZ
MNKFLSDQNKNRLELLFTYLDLLSNTEVESEADRKRRVCDEIEKILDIEEKPESYLIKVRASGCPEEIAKALEENM